MSTPKLTVPQRAAPGEVSTKFPTEYGWIKYTSKRTKKPPYEYETWLTDFPEIVRRGDDPRETLAQCFEALADKIRCSKRDDP